MRYWIILCIFTIGIMAFQSGQAPSYPQDFEAPTKGPLYLSGTFGELRPAHFHSAIDIKGKIGQTLVAVADGYVSRIKVSANGYGNALYISHPAYGYTTVYAHLDHYTPEVAAFIKSHQYNKESFEVDLYPQKDQFPFKKGQKVGALGLSGRSYGPHLHFEIRESKSQKPVNPLFFGFDVKDSKEPRMHELKVYELNDKAETLASKKHNLQRISGGYGIKGNTILTESEYTGLGLKVYDHMDGVNNWNGIYALEMFRDDSLVWHFDCTKFAFSETRYLNAHLDYAEHYHNKAYINRCYRLPGNQLSIYSDVKEEGVIRLQPGEQARIKMIAADVAGNTTTLHFQIKRKENSLPPVDQSNFNYFLPYDEKSLIDNGAVKLLFPEGALYENLYMEYYSLNDESDNIYAPVHHIHNPVTPLHKYFDIHIQAWPIPDEKKDKAFIAFCGRDNSIQNCGGKWKDGMLTTKVRSLGDYTIMLDEIPPVIKPVSLRADMRGRSLMSFKITDNYAVTGRGKGLRYKATVDGNWILMELDGKKNLLVHRFDGRITPGEHQLQLEVWDDRGNRAVFERVFVR